MTDFDDVLRNPVTRRAFLARMGAAGLGAAATGLLLAGCGGSSSNKTSSGGSTNVQFADTTNFPGIPGSTENMVVLNFALTLETLEADLYRQAVNVAAGKPASTPAPANNDYSSYSLALSPGGFDSTQAAVGFLYLQQYAGVEATHRDFLRGVLGSAAVPANPTGYKLPASATTDLKSLLTLISAVEEQGVRAYLGAAGFLTDLPTIQVASTIYSTEARHSAGVNYILRTNAGLSQSSNNGLEIGPTPGANGQAASTDMKVTPNYPSPNTFEYFNKPSQVLQFVKPFFA